MESKNKSQHSETESSLVTDTYFNIPLSDNIDTVIQRIAGKLLKLQNILLLLRLP
jgi:hypothetical protein